MAEFSTTELKRMSDDMIIQAIGEYVQSVRLERNMTQEELGERAGVHRMTVRDLELGKRSALLTLIQVMRIFDELQNLKHFKASRELNPIEWAKLEAKQRKPANGAKSNPKSETTDW